MNICKFSRRFLATVSAMALAFGCIEKPEVDPTPNPPAPAKDPVITLDAASATVPAQAGSGSMSINIENAVSGETAKAVSDASWLTVTGTTNSSVAYKYEENTQKDSRSAKVTVSYGKAQTKAFAVCQEGSSNTDEPKTPVIILKTPGVKVPHVGGQFELEYEIENPVEGASLKAEASDWWILIDGVSDNKVMAHCGPNYSMTAMSGAVTLSYPGAEPQKASVEQASMPLPPEVHITEPSGTIPAEGGSFEILLDIENPVEGVNIELEGAPFWVKIESVSNEKIVGSCEPNATEYARSGDVQFHYEGAAHYCVTIRQEAGKGSEPDPQPVIHFAFDEANLPYKETYFKVGYYIDNPREGVDIEVKSDQDWLEVEGLEGGCICCVARTNSGAARTGMLTVTYPDAETKLFQVKQEAVPENRPVIVTSIPQDRYEASWMGEVYDFQVSVEGVSFDELFDDLALASDSPWLIVAGVRDEKVCRLYIEHNLGNAARTGHVTIYFGDAEPKVIEVIQNNEEKNKPWIYVNKDLWENLSFQGSSVWLTYSIWNKVPGIELTYKSDQTWLKVTRMTDSNLEVSYDSNPSEKERTAHMTLSYPGADDVTVTFKQEAYRYLKPVITLDSYEMTGASYGARSYGLSYSIDNFTDLSLLKITSDTDWIRIDTYDEYSLNFALESNPNYTSRTGHITFAYEGADNAVFTITQIGTPRAEPRIEVTEHSQYHPQEGTKNGVTKVLVLSPWAEYELTAVSSNDAVCRVNGVVLTSQSEDFNQYEVRYTVSANNTHSDRSASITLKYGDKTRVLDIKQFSTEKPVIFPVTDRIHVPFTGATGLKLRYDIANPVAGTKLTVNTKASWVTASSIADDEITFNVNPNSNLSARSTVVTLKYADADPVDVTIEQDAWVPDPFFGFVDDKVVLNRYGDSKTVRISLENFDISEFDSINMETGWAAIDAYDLAKKTMAFRAAQNNTGAYRQIDAVVNITLKSGKVLSAGITIAQDSDDLILGHDRSEINVNADEHTEVIRFTPETRFDYASVNVKGVPSWISTSRSGDNITLKIARNNSSESRSATLVFSYYHHKDVSIVVTQRGRTDLPAAVVDLGLPSGKLWTTMNVGASNPSDSGTFFAWGETTGKSSYTWDNYIWGHDENIKYPGTKDLAPVDDPAAKAYGTDYRMPTIIDFIELEENCKLAEETLNGVKGLRISNRKDSSKSIFIPYSGYKDGTTMKEKNNGMSLWTNSRHGKDFEAVMVIGDSEQVSGISMERYLGVPVRAVYIPD